MKSKKILLCFGIRPEAIKMARIYYEMPVLTGTNKDKIVKAHILTDNFKGFKNTENPYGNGKTSEKIAKFLLNTYSWKK